MSAKRTEKFDPNNKNRHSKSVTESIDKNEYKQLPTRDRPRKHRYIMFLGRIKKILKKNLKYEIMPYPKGDNKKYDASYSPVTQQIIQF